MTTLTDQGIDGRVRVAKALNASGAAPQEDQDHWYDALEAMASRVRKDNPRLTAAQAFREACHTEEGRHLLQVYKRAPFAKTKPVDAQPTAAPTPTNRPKDRTAYSSLLDLARGLRAANPKLTEQQAFREASRQRPDLYAKAR